MPPDGSGRRCQGMLLDQHLALGELENLPPYAHVKWSKVT